MAPARTRQFWFVTFPGSELLDVSGPWAVLGYANEVLGRQAYVSQLISPVAGTSRPATR
jgi:transcriptional regulator GlxA family with amidase domain